MSWLLASLALSLGVQTAPPVVISPQGGVVQSAPLAIAPSRRPPPGRPELLPLPTGELRPFSIGARALHFLDTASIRRDGDVVSVNYYTVFHPGTPSGDRLIVHWISEARVDCRWRLAHSTRLSAYDEAGEEVLWLFPEEPAPIQAGSVQADLHLVVCQSPIDIAPRLTGWPAALAFARAKLAAGP